MGLMLGCLQLELVKMGHGCVPHRWTIQCECGMHRQGNKLGHHWKVTFISCIAFR